MRVAGGAVAKKILSMLDVDISAGVVQIGHIAAEKVSTLEAANNEFNFVDRKKIPDLEAFFNQLLKEQDSVGAKILVRIWSHAWDRFASFFKTRCRVGKSNDECQCC